MHVAPGALQVRIHTRKRATHYGIITWYARSKHQPHLAFALLDAIGFDGLFGRAGAHLAAVGIELRAMPEALHGAADEHAVGQRAAAMGAMILKCTVTSVGARQRDAGAVIDADQLHLIQLELIAFGDNGAVTLLGLLSGDLLLFP